MLTLGYLKMSWTSARMGQWKVARIMLGLIWTDRWTRWERRLFPRRSEWKMVRSMRPYSLHARRILLNGRTWRQVVRERRGAR